VLVMTSTVFDDFGSQTSKGVNMTFPGFDLDGKVAFLTGGDKGIGQGIAAGLAKAGAHIAFTTRNMERAAETIAVIEDIGQPVMAAELDVTRLHTIQTVVDQIIGRYGRIDILVNNAGYNFAMQPFEVTEDKWDAIYDTNVKGLFFVSQAVGKVMASQGGGKVVNISSQAGFVAMPKRVAYCSSKAAVIHITRVLALEWAPLNINVNAVAPTFVKTELTAGYLADPEFGKYVKESILLDRLGTPEDVAAAVIYLSSPAADMVTGHTLLVDGGWTIH
jgi:NAD(P)-dependent dehydrogenase (short-subunit alcohol dehydrogenase family)